MAAAGPGGSGGVVTDRPPLTRGRSLTDVLRGIVLSNQSQQPLGSGGGANSKVSSIAEESTGNNGANASGISHTSGTLGSQIQSHGLTAGGVGSGDLPGPPSEGARGGSWSFFWRTSAQRVIEMNRATETPSAGDETGEQKSKILGGYTDAGNGETRAARPIGSLVEAVSAMQQLEAAKAGGTTNHQQSGVKKSSLLHLPDKMNVGKKDMNVFSPSSF